MIKKLHEHFVGHLRIGLAATFLHHLAYEEAHDTVFTRLVLFHRLGIFRQHFLHHGFDFGGVADLYEALFLDDCLGLFAFFAHLAEDFLPGIVVDLAGFNLLEKVGEIFSFEGNVHFPVVGDFHAAQKFRHKPIGKHVVVRELFRHFFIEVGDFFRTADDFRVVFFQAVGVHKAGDLHIGKFRHACAHLFDPFVVNKQRAQVSFRRKAIVAGRVLHAHDHGLVFRVIPAAGGAKFRLALFHKLDLAGHFVVDGLFNGAERVQVLHFGNGASLPGFRVLNIDINVAAQGAFFHFHVTDFQIAQGVSQFFQEQARFQARRHVRIGDDFHQRHAAAVVVHESGAVFRVQALARVFFQLNLVDADLFRAVIGFDFDVTFVGHRFVRLGNLIALG